jgi:hypothetical protein
MKLTFEKRREAAADITRLALVMEAAQTLKEWGQAAEAINKRMEILCNDSATFPYSSKVQLLLERGKRLQEALHAHCGAPLSPEDDGWDWRNTK